MAFRSNVLSQILKMVNRDEFENEVSRSSGDYKTHKISCFNLLVVLIFGQLRGKKTLRDLVIALTLSFNNFYHWGLKSCARSTLADSLSQRPAKVFENFYYKLLDRLNRSEKRDLKKRKIFLVDSTTISLCIEKFDWAKYKSTKGGIKLHIVYNATGQVAQKVYISNAKVHDIKGIRRQIVFEEGAFYVYDRGYACCQYLYGIQRKKAFFITRIKSNWTYNVIETKEVPPDSNILADRIIELTGSKAKSYPDKMRCVSFYHAEAKKILHFITNNFEISIEEIANLYKTRWQIELFFKWIKQHLKVKSFYSTSRNGVKIQIWCALICHLLLQLIRKQLVLNVDPFEIFRRVQEALDWRIDLFDLIHMRASSPPVKDSCQMELKFA